MHEITVPLIVPTPSVTRLGDLVTRVAARDAAAITFTRREDDDWHSVTAGRFAAEVRAWAKGFHARGIRPGEPVAIMSRTRYEWTVADFALWSLGAVPVPIYETSSAEQVQWILENSGAVGIVAETERHAEIVGSVRDRVPALRELWVLDRGDGPTLAAAGEQVPDEVLDTAVADVGPSSLATIIYTSGTTGRPKGVRLTHGNFLALADNAIEELAVIMKAPDAATLLFLPLAHVFARFIEVLCVAAGARLAHSADIKGLLDDLAEVQPTFVLAVPRVFEKIYNSAEARARAGGKGAIFEKATEVALAWSEAREAGRTPPLGIRVQHALYDRLVYGTLRKAMGGKVAHAVSGGAPLGTRLGHFYRGMGVTILEGYGLTETTAPATVNTPTAIHIGTVGRPLPGCGIRIDEDGEILIRGIGLFEGYHDNPEATAEAIDADGWFHSGDIGELTDQGFLRITGRKKELLVTAGGKNVAPAVLEDRLRAHPLISQCIVVGDAKPFIGALITLDAEMLPLWAANNGVAAGTVETARTDAAVLAELQRAVDHANEAVSKAEAIRKFAVLDLDFTEESGHLTPSLKLKRNVVMRDFADDVDALYGG